MCRLGLLSKYDDLVHLAHGGGGLCQIRASDFCLLGARAPGRAQRCLPAANFPKAPCQHLVPCEMS